MSQLSGVSEFRAQKKIVRGNVKEFLFFNCVNLKFFTGRVNPKLFTRRMNYRLIFKQGRQPLRSDTGNVESAMVLIPLVILFLIAFEIIIATNLRNGEAAMAQGEASRRAISGEIAAPDEVIELASPDRFAHIRLLVSHHRRSLPQVLPGLIAIMGGAPTIDVRGVAVMEPTQ
jgi:hypothetical protein